MHAASIKWVLCLGSYEAEILPGGSGEEAAFKVIQVIGRIYLLWWQDWTMSLQGLVEAALGS